jgi:hypothetical protein
MALTTLGAVRTLPRLVAAGWLGLALARLFRPRAGPRPLDPAALSPRWLRDLGLPEDYGRTGEEQRWRP